MKHTLRGYIAVSILALSAIARGGEAAKSVVFVCEHGSVKSVIAASFFNRMAEEQKLNCRAISRGTTPEDTVPVGVAENLKKDGFEVAAFKPKALVDNDASQAVVVIAFCDVAKELADPAHVSTWLNIPPASTDYDKSKAAMLPKIAALVAELKAK